MVNMWYPRLHCIKWCIQHVKTDSLYIFCQRPSEQWLHCKWRCWDKLTVGCRPDSRPGWASESAQDAGLYCRLAEYGNNVEFYEQRNFKAKQDKQLRLQFVSFLGQLFWVDLIKWVSNVRLSVRMFIPSQKVSLISMKFGLYVEVDEWCTTVCSMTQSKVKVTCLQSWKSGHFYKLSIYRFLIFGLVFVSCDFDVGTNVSCEELTVSPVRG